MTRKKLALRLYESLWGETKKRSYQAARLNRQNADWLTSSTSANWETRVSLVQLRARARQLARDDGYIKKFLSLVRSNVIGQKGLMLQSRARSQDGTTLNIVLNKKVEEAWWQWGHKETCTISGRLNWLGVQRLVVTQLARDGEFLVQKVRANNPFGFSLKVWNVDYLDEQYNETYSPTGNRIIMSVEIDATDKPVAYWLTTPASEVQFSLRKTRTRIRVPAEDMIHGFLSFDDESAVRGITWFHAAALPTKNFHGYREGVVQSARMSANTFAVLKQDAPDGAEYTGGEDEDGNAIMPVINSAPLSMTALPPGWEMQQFDPKQPTQNHAEFAKSMLIDVGAALDVPYFQLAGDLEAVNFSSARVGLEEAKDIWRALQDFVADNLCREVFHSWALEAMLSGALKISAKEFAEIQNPKWRGRGWSYIDPAKEANAVVTLLANNLSTWTDELNERGIDLTDFLERRKAEKELAAQYGVDLVIVPPPTGLKPQQEADAAPADQPPKKRGYANGDAELIA